MNEALINSQEMKQALRRYDNLILEELERIKKAKQLSKKIKRKHFKKGK